MSLFDQDVHALSTSLQGMELELPDGSTVTITGTDTFTRDGNDRGVYKPMLDMRPGEVFAPKVQGHPMFLIVALNTEGGESGACVRIIGLDTGDGRLSGGGRCGKFVGFTEHGQIGRIVEQANGTLLLEVTGTLESRRPATSGTSTKRRRKGPLSSAVTSQYMAELTTRYQQDAGDGDTFEAWLPQVQADHNTEAKLRRFLKL